MKYGCRAHDYGCFTAKGLADVLTANGYNAAQLAMPKAIRGIPNFTDITPAQLTDIRTAFAEAGIEISVLSCYQDLSNPDTAIRENAVAAVCRALHYQKAVGAKHVGSESACRDLTEDEKAALATGCEKDAKGLAGCASCAKKRGDAVDARHFVLGGALVSTFIFGFPVFCLVCPIGLTFATILLLVNLFGQGDVTWSLIVVPALLIAEVVLFKKWCHKLCPLSAFMSLIAKLNRTFKPTIDDAKCLETSKGTPCSRCAMVCEADINLRHPEYGERTLADCTRCHSCVDACPASAITMPVVAKRGANEK